MAKISEVYKKAVAEGKAAGVLSSDIRLLVAHDEGFASPIDTLYHQDDEMTQNELFNSQFADLKAGKPIEYIINEASFLHRKLYVDPRVLIPRMETEELVAGLTECIDQYYDPRNYLVCADIGTGSGAIAIALKTFFSHWVIIASDSSSDALEVAKKNITDSGLRIETYFGSSLQPFIERKTNLDIIVSNPPYISDPETAQKSVRDYEPSSALWLDKNHSVYEDVFRDCYQVKSGTLLMCFEIAPELQDYLIGLMKKYLKDYEYEFKKDLSGSTRFLFVFLK